MEFLKRCVVFAACVFLCASDPTPNKALPVLKDQKAEVLFRVENNSTALLECAIENGDSNVQYSWFKDGAPFDWKAAGHIAERPGEGSIMFFNPQPNDEGVYQCFVKTSAGTASTRPISFKKAFLNAPAKVEPQEHNPVLGKPYKLECQIPESYPKPTISWLTQLRSDPSNYEPILNHRITLSPDGNLWFSNVTESDASYTYICGTTKGVILAEHFFKSLEESKEPNNGELVAQYLSNDMIAKAGDETMIYCIYGGTPVGCPDWFKHDDLIETVPGDRVTDYFKCVGKYLYIKRTLLEDQGTYKCEVNNEVGKKQTHSMKLTVVSAPQFVDKLEKQIAVKENHDIDIPCKVTGLPEPKVTWSYNGKTIEKYKYTNGIFSIDKVTKGQSGYYGCRAENEHGLIYAETLVNVL